jgi:hypothetical protein
MFQHPPRCFSSLSSSLKLSSRTFSSPPPKLVLFMRKFHSSGGAKLSHVNLKPNMKLIANSFIARLIDRLHVRGEAAAMFE